MYQMSTKGAIVMRFDEILSFYKQTDEQGVTNLEKASSSQIIRRVKTTDQNKSFEETDEEQPSEYPRGMVVENGKLIGFGIHIFNEDIYPLQSFEIYLRNVGLSGVLDLSGQEDLLFVDIYNNQVSEVLLKNNRSLRIFGVQNNRISELDVRDMVVCQGIDAGKNQLSELDVSENAELVELYINDNRFSTIDLSKNQKLKYFYCHNNQISKLDTTCNPLLRHLNATGNPMKEIYSLAPQREERLPLTVVAGEGGYVGLKFNPVYNAQWKETGEWEQSYYAYPMNGYAFDGWYDRDGCLVSNEAVWIDQYGSSREIKAIFR